MKKLIFFILSLSLVLPLCACGGSGANGGSEETKAAEGL